VTAVVRDRKGRFVKDLRRDDFQVVEAGQSKPILDFRAETDGPVRLALVVDISGSMRLGRKAVDAKQGAKQIFSALRPGDEAALFTFDTGLDKVSDFTSDVAALEAALDRVQPPYGQTSIYDAVAVTARSVAGTRGPVPAAQRRAVVVLTDGIDTRSRLTSEQVASIAGGIDVPVYVMALLTTVDDPREVVEGVRPVIDESGLGNLSRGTGGELFLTTAPAHASVAARQIVAELRHQYVLAFEASARPGWRPVEVRARNRGHVVRARAGYSAGGGNGEGAQRN
jgi:VWFA-related protein